MSNEKSVEVEVGEKGAVFSARYQSLTSIDRQPAGLNFYELSWPVAAMGHVYVRQEFSQLQLENVLSVMGIENTDFLEEGISEIKINFALTKNEKIHHDEARIKIHELMQMLMAAGWKTLIPRDTARIHGSQMTAYLLSSNDFLGFDPMYLPTLKEWMRYQSQSQWNFYRDRVFLSLEFTREHTLLDPEAPGAYLLSIHLQNEAQHFRDYVKPADRQRWKDLLLPVTTKMGKKRAAMESEMRMKGIAIDESYADPPLPVSIK